MRGKSSSPSQIREVRAARTARPAVTCKGPALKAQFAKEGITSIEGMAEALDYHGLGGISRALNGQPVSSWFIAAVRLRFPKVKYEHLFIEGQVAVDAPAPAAA